MARRRESFKRRAMKFLCTVLGILLTLMVAVTLYAHQLMGDIQLIDPDAIPTISQEELDKLLGIDPFATEPEDVDFDDHNLQIGGRGSPLVNILLIGQDRRPGEDRARSDSMILVSFNKKTGQVTLTSFLRDLYVEIPGYQDNRINAAYAAGGMTLLNSTLKHNFGIHVDGNVEVDFDQFANIVDLIGGVEIELRRDEADEINVLIGGTLRSGKQKLNGQQALTYARIRSLDADGDFSRTERQRKVLNAIVETYKDAGIPKLLSLVDDLLPMITTDMSYARMLTLALELVPMVTNVELSSQRIPADGTYEGRSIRGMSVLVADMDANRKVLAETLLGE